MLSMKRRPSILDIKNMTCTPPRAAVWSSGFNWYIVIFPRQPVHLPVWLGVGMISLDPPVAFGPGKELVRSHLSISRESEWNWPATGRFLSRIQC